jgi:hypothetical protein
MNNNTEYAQAQTRVRPSITTYKGKVLNVFN